MKGPGDPQMTRFRLLSLHPRPAPWLGTQMRVQLSQLGPDLPVLGKAEVLLGGGAVWSVL